MKKVLTPILFALLCSAVYPQNITNTLGTGGVFRIKDGSSTFFSLSQSTGHLSLSRNLILPNTTDSTLGMIYKEASRFLHNYGTNNTFLGVNSGNFTLTGTYNSAFGYYSLNSNTTGFENSAFGVNSLRVNTTGYRNSAFGNGSLNNNTTGYENSAFGYASLFLNTTGRNNSAFGSQSLYSNTTGYYNSAFGMYSLERNTTGSSNSAFGNSSLYWNTTGFYNSAFGDLSLNSNTTGNQNSAFGNASLMWNTTGSNNSAFGNSSLYWNTTGYRNSAFGDSSLYSNITGNSNSALGNGSLKSNTTGLNNTAIGYYSLNLNTIGSYNTALGFGSLVNNTGNYNTSVGHNAGSTITTGANLTCIGIDANPSSPTAIDQITLGNIYVSSLRCAVTTITSLSDMRDKKNITDLSLGLDFITKLKPRLFNWDKREWYENNTSDGTKMQETPTAGFIAQELDSVQTNANAGWLNLVLKDNPEKWEATPGNLLPVLVKAIQELKAENDELKQNNISLTAEVETLNEKFSNLEKLVSDILSVKNVDLTEKK